MREVKVDLDEMIEHEKRQIALEYQHEAWAGGKSDGIEEEIMAEAAIGTAVTELLETAGEDAVLNYIESVKQQIISGAFTTRTLQ